jgi:glycerophosphoryl diester phosphodiesterase
MRQKPCKYLLIVHTALVAQHGTNWQMTRPIDIQGHRGARALFPENTLEGFLAASRLGVAAFELDVGMTADGMLVVTHDLAINPDIARDVNGAWLGERGPTVWSLSFAELFRYDVGRLRPGSATAALYPEQRPHDGARIPTLASVLAALPAARFTIEVKTDPRHPDWTASAAALADATLAAVDAAGAAGRVTIEAFDWRVQRYIRGLRRDIQLAWLTRPETVRDSALWWDLQAPGSSVPAIVAAEGGPVWAPDHTRLTRTEVDEAHAVGLSVLPWTVNQPADMRRLIDWGVDALISDRPDLALAVAASTA